MKDTKSYMRHLLDEISKASVGGAVCDRCGTGGSLCLEEGQCDYITKQRSASSDSMLDPHKVKQLSLEWQERS